MLSSLSILMTGQDLKRGSEGLGPNSWGYIRILIPYGGRFYQPSCEHDLNYSWGGDEYDKRLADEQFYDGCIALSGNWLAALFATAYYLGVAKFGYKYFNYRKAIT